MRKIINTLLVTRLIVKWSYYRKCFQKRVHMWKRIIGKPASAYVKTCDWETKGMYFLIEYDELFESYKDISNQVNNSIKKKLNCKPIHKKQRIIGLLVLFLRPSSINKKINSEKKKIFSRIKFFLYFRKWNFLTLTLKDFLYFLIFREMELFKKTSYISGNGIL